MFFILRFFFKPKHCSVEGGKRLIVQPLAVILCEFGNFNFFVIFGLYFISYKK